MNNDGKAGQLLLATVAGDGGRPMELPNDRLHLVFQFLRCTWHCIVNSFYPLRPILDVGHRSADQRFWYGWKM
jgi:hypothetical protein